MQIILVQVIKLYLGQSNTIYEPLKYLCKDMFIQYIMSSFKQAREAHSSQAS